MPGHQPIILGQLLYEVETYKTYCRRVDSGHAAPQEWSEMMAGKRRQ
jgi:hypothetical protein